MIRLVAVAMVVLCGFLANGPALHAEPVKVIVRGGDKAFREQVISLLFSGNVASSAVSGRADVRLELQKKGGAKVKCGRAEAFLPGPSAAEIVSQFRTWLPSALATREADEQARASRAELLAQALAAFAAGWNSSNRRESLTSTPFATGAGTLLLFGGENHTVFLGCLNCSEYATDSVRNQYGRHGSPYATASIVNPYSRFGSPYSTYSACNPFASDPPVIVDGAGNFYGRLTVSVTHPQRTRSADLQAWIQGVCAR